MTSRAQTPFQPGEVQTRKGRSLTLRTYSAEDFEALVKMYVGFEPKRIAQGLPPPDAVRTVRWLEELQRNSEALLAFDGQKIVAHTILCPIDPEEVEFTIFVLQGYREEGLGTGLSKATLEWARAMKFRRVLLTTELSNYRAVRLFRKIGFRIKSSYGDECEMKLDLSAESEAQAA
jgi:RimJ/RimL family protein N-acetyltransferase